MSTGLVSMHSGVYKLDMLLFCGNVVILSQSISEETTFQNIIETGSQARKKSENGVLTLLHP